MPELHRCQSPRCGAWVLDGIAVAGRFYCDASCAPAQAPPPKKAEPSPIPTPVPGPAPPARHDTEPSWDRWQASKRKRSR